MTLPDHPTQIALVTGTSSGIGEAVACELLSRKWRVIGLSRRPAAIENPQYSHLQLDLANVAELTRVQDEVGHVLANSSVARLGLVNCAADPGLLGPLERVDPVQMLRVCAVNVVAPAWLMGWLVHRGKRNVPIRIVNVSSGADVTPYAGLGAYGSTKAALRMAGMILACELDSQERTDGRRDVTILSYSPGAVDTPMQVAVRSSTIETLPIVDLFKQLAADGLLAPPSRPAAEIAAYLDGNGHARFVEQTFGTTPREGSAA